MSDGEFAGKVVLVTGAASGLGRAASIRFASEGGRVCLVDINADGLAETARRIEEAGGECASMAGDLGNPAVDADRALLEAAGVQASWQLTPELMADAA